MFVTIAIVPEEKNEGDYGQTVNVSKRGVVTLNQLVKVYLAAAKGAGWEVESIGAVSPKGKEFWGED